MRAMREAYEQAVAGWSKAMEENVAGEDFAAASGQFLKRYVEMQESLRTASKAGAEAMHIPTADDLARVAQLVINVERKVDEVSDEVHLLIGRLASIEATLDELAKRPTQAPAAKAAKAAKTAKPPAKPARRRTSPKAGV